MAMGSATTTSSERGRPTRDLWDPWPLQLLLWVALGPYFSILTVARHVPQRQVRACLPACLPA